MERELLPNPVCLSGRKENTILLTYITFIYLFGGRLLFPRFAVCQLYCVCWLTAWSAGYLDFPKGMNKVSTYVLTYLPGNAYVLFMMNIYKYAFMKQMRVWNITGDTIHVWILWKWTYSFRKSVLPRLREQMYGVCVCVYAAIESVPPVHSKAGWLLGQCLLTDTNNSSFSDDRRKKQGLHNAIVRACEM